MNGILLSPSGEFMDELQHVATTMESLEIRLSILSVQMQYADSTFSQQAVDLSRQFGETSERLQALLLSRANMNGHSIS